MATVSDITTTPLSGLNHIDALLDSGPDWNYLTNASNAPVYTISYTFSTASGTEDATSAAANFSGAQQAFTASQQAATRTAFAYISQLTGIQFVETAVGTDAQIHLSNANLLQSNVTGLCSWHSSYTYSGTQIASYDADAYVYLDNAEFSGQNGNLAPGGAGYQTLLHELGHALGLKHPFDTTSDNAAHLPTAQDNTATTLMSYTSLTNTNYSTYQADDIAALEWLYGGDGLRGALGINSTTGGRFIVGTSAADTLTGTAADDKFQGNGGNDMIDGGAGNDTAVFSGTRNNYLFSTLGNGDLQVASLDGTNSVTTLHAIETLQFGQDLVARADVSATLAVPMLAVALNDNGYGTGSAPLVSGTSAVGTTIKIFNADNNVQVGTATVDAQGVWSTTLSTYADGLNYKVYAVAYDAAGHTSDHSVTATFNIDGHTPVNPTMSVSIASGSNVATFVGTGEAGSQLDLYSVPDGNQLGTTTVGADGTWTINTSPLLNGTYSVNAVSSDKADNSAVTNSPATLTVASADNFSGTSGDDTLQAREKGNAIDGGAGRDTVVYAGPAANYTVSKETWGFGVTDNVGNGGHDALINVERVQFSDVTVTIDIDGQDGQLYRLYQAIFDRTPDAWGFGYWVDRMDHGTTMDTVVHEFMTNQPEFTKLYGDNPSNADFLTKVYENVLHRGPDDAGYAFWLNAMNGGYDNQESILEKFSESPENQAQVIGSLQHGFAYTPWAGH